MILSFAQFPLMWYVVDVPTTLDADLVHPVMEALAKKRAQQADATAEADKHLHF